MRTKGLILVASLLVPAVAAAQEPPEEEAPPPQAPNPEWAPPTPQEPPPDQQPVPTPEQPQPPPYPSDSDIATPETTEPQEIEPPWTLEIYGFTMLDFGYDFGHIGDPLWFDVLRPTKLPAFPNEFGKHGRTFAGVRQTRFGTKWSMPTDHGDVNAKFEWELFGVGREAGETTFRLRHAYGEWRGLRAGQTWSPFMDPDVFPNSLEYWGPNGMVFFRNVQLAYEIWKTESSDFTVAIERPGGSADSDLLGQRIDLENVVPRFPAPDVSADIKYGCSWGYLRLAGIMRYMAWDDISPTPVVEGHAWGWGVNASANVKLAPVLLKLQAAGGRGIENYMNDAGADVAPRNDVDPAGVALVQGRALPVVGILAFADIQWNDMFTSSVGYSFVWIDNSDGQANDAFHIGHYALGNIEWHPLKQLMMGAEFQWGRRQNFRDGFAVNDYRLQFGFRYDFGKKFSPR